MESGHARPPEQLVVRRILRGLLLHLPLSLVCSWLFAVAIAEARYPDIADESRYERLFTLLLTVGPALALANHRVRRSPHPAHAGGHLGLTRDPLAARPLFAGRRGDRRRHTQRGGPAGLSCHNRSSAVTT